MALMTCPDCANQYPDDAPYCPNCGRPNPARAAGAASGPGQPETPVGTGPTGAGYTGGTGPTAGAGNASNSPGGGAYAGGTGEAPAGGAYGGAPGAGYGGTGGTGGTGGYGGGAGGGYGGGTAAGGPPQQIPKYLVHAILVTLCCCLPFGIVSIIYATQVNTKRDAGDIAGAMEASANAKKWAMIGAGVGVVWLIIIIAFNGLALLAGLAGSASGG
jgi:Interferon-induced transmembrane protein